MKRLKLRARIVEKFGTNRQFAEAVGITPTTVTNVLRGKSTPTSRMLAIWCAALDIAPEESGIFFTAKPLKTEE